MVEASVPLVRPHSWNSLTLLYFEVLDQRNVIFDHTGHSDSFNRLKVGRVGFVATHIRLVYFFNRVHVGLLGGKEGTTTNTRLYLGVISGVGRRALLSSGFSFLDEARSV